MKEILHQIGFEPRLGNVRKLIKPSFRKNYKVGRTRVFDLRIISSRSIQYRVTELMVCRIQEKR